jgi:hypothetical protein
LQITIMPTAATVLPRNVLPHDIDALGPQNEAEQQLYALIMQSIDGPSAEETTITELVAELHTRIQARR